MQRGSVPDSALIVRSSDATSAGAIDEAVILDPESGRYYGLEGVGAFVWELIQEPRSVGEVREAVLGAYDVDPEQWRSDLEDLLRELVAAGLVSLRDDSGP